LIAAHVAAHSREVGHALEGVENRRGDGKAIGPGAKIL